MAEEEEQAEQQQQYENFEDEKKQQEYQIEGFFDYKNLMINPASEEMTFNKRNIKNTAKTMFKLINRDLQLGFLNEKEFKIIFLHLHLGTELLRFGILQAGCQMIQKAYTLLVMSNSRNGSLRKLEATTIRISKLQQDKSKGGGWLRRRNKG